MKGLLIKDIRLLKNQKQFFLIICLVGTMLLFTSGEPSFVISYMTFVFSMFTLSSISYDEYDNGLAFLFSLPISRKKYVREKYVFGLLLGGTAWTVTTAVVSAYMTWKKQEIDWKSWLVTACIYLALFVVFLLIILPIQFKFGAEKGRIAMLGAMGIIFLSIYAGTKIAGKIGIDIDAALMRIGAASTGEIIGTLVIACCVIAVISYNVSLRIMKKKQF
ncbi:transporter [Lachnospiraceae bacterium]|uniref:ABC-2 transporter permease n=1 Tax=Extibacter sp. GGCC_0201 TaxID=2731209 RepID=UPI001AA1BA70|nr:ABC-2 transporter permease [Extibacter sp. GGCC_0201]MBO1719531.1 ABC-2 transporter permease [Extibacter sp. GGCC_0201]BDF32709.1 transporter [Lachnospiraceae bacterium]BDF36715.1 transporter [Lachnospiraceae bacterium]